MRIKLNGKEEETQATTVEALLKSKNIEPRMVAVEVRSQMVERSQYAETLLHEGDSIEFLFFMGGGANR